MNDFWIACGHHLLDRDENGGLCVTDEFLKAYFARPELMPLDDACPVERRLHRDAALLPRVLAALGDRLPHELVLLVEQADEIFTLVPAGQSRRQGVELLRHALTASGRWPPNRAPLPQIRPRFADQLECLYSVEHVSCLTTTYFPSRLA